MQTSELLIESRRSKKRLMHSIVLVAVVGFVLMAVGCSASSKLKGEWVTADGVQKVTFSSDAWFREVTIDPSRPGQVNIQAKFATPDATTLELTAQDGTKTIYAISWEDNNHVSLNLAGAPVFSLLKWGSPDADAAIKTAETEATERTTADNPEESLPSRIESYYGSIQRHDYMMAFSNSPQIEQSNEWTGDFGSVRDADFDLTSYEKDRVWSEGGDTAYALYWVSDSQGNQYQDKWTYTFEPWSGWKTVAREDTGEIKTDDQSGLPAGHPALGGTSDSETTDY